jgi:hypothetical protein
MVLNGTGMELEWNWNGTGRGGGMELKEGQKKSEPVGTLS